MHKSMVRGDFITNYSIESVEVDSRLIRLIDILGGESDYITLEALSKKLKYSRRQVEYDVNRIGDLFYEVGLQSITTKQNKGIKLEKDHLIWFGNIFKENQTKAKYVYQKDERVALIIIQIIIGGSLYRYEDLCSLLGVSRTTIFGDMKDVKEIIESHGATLHYDYYYKYFIKATGIQYNKMLKESSKLLFTNIPQEIFKYLVEEEIYREIIKL